MSSSTRTALLASLLVIGAITLGLTRQPTNPKPDRPKNPIPTFTRSKLPNRHATIAQLLSSKSESLDRKSWSKSLSDEDLKRLTLEMIEAYQSDDDHSKTTPWLTSLAMEWGRRDIDEFLEESKRTIYQDEQDEWKNLGIFSSLKSAALVGLSEDDPSAAWFRFNDDNPRFNTDNLPILSRTNADFIRPVNTPTETSLTAEAIFRSWEKMDAAAAWKELSSSNDRDTSKLAPAIRGLLAETKSAELRNEIVEWINQNYPVMVIPGIPRTAGADITNIVNDSPRKGDGVITRNSIDSILNNPNRLNQDPYAMQGAIALGLAEQDPSQVERLTEPLTVDSQKTIPMGSYLTEWVDRHPNEAIAFQSENLLTDRDRTSIATGLFNHDPRAALDTFTGIEDPQTRLDAFNRWVDSSPWLGRSEPWPLIDGMQTYIPVGEALQSLEQNIARLGLPPQSEQKAIEALKRLATSSNTFSSGGFEFPSEGE